MTSRRRGMYWMPFSEGTTLLTMAANTSSRLFIASIRETEVGRTYEGFTVTRMVFNVTAFSDAGSGNVLSMGIILLPADVVLTSILPGPDKLVDWLWNEDHVVGIQNTDLTLKISRDIRSQRKARGGDSELWFYAENRDSVNAISLHRSGRALIKRA